MGLIQSENLGDTMCAMTGCVDCSYVPERSLTSLQEPWHLKPKYDTTSSTSIKYQSVTMLIPDSQSLWAVLSDDY